jgi:hypothetical protein
MVAPNICGASVWKLLRVTFMGAQNFGLAPRFLYIFYTRVSNNYTVRVPLGHILCLITFRSVQTSKDISNILYENLRLVRRP